MIDTVTYKQWTAVDRSSLETVSQHSDDFIETFCEKLEALCSHSFIASQQSKFFDESKSSLKPDEIIVCALENYAFVIQDAALEQLMPKQLYILLSFITENQTPLQYNILTLWLYLTQYSCCTSYSKEAHFILEACSKFFPVKIMYFSDGASSQYKSQKNFTNLCNHQADFHVSAEWHSMEEYDLEKGNLETRFNNCQIIPGTRRLYCFIPQSQDTVLTKRYSACSNAQLQRVNKFSTDLEVEEVTGHVTCIHRSQWWVVQVLEKDSENGELKLSLMDLVDGIIIHLAILHVPITDILIVVKPRTTTGRSYSLTQDESKAATQKLKKLLI